jgi:hypothetical protein
MLRHTLLLAFSLAIGFPGGVEAEVLEVTPATTAVLDGVEVGSKSVVLLFDLTALEPGRGRQIDEAILDWPITGMSAEKRYDFEIFAITQPWTADGVAAVTEVVTPPDPESVWDLEPLDFQRNKGGLLRFDLTRLVRMWAENPGSNRGVEIRGSDWDQAVLRNQLSRARLTIRYGFVGG